MLDVRVGRLESAGAGRKCEWTLEALHGRRRKQGQRRSTGVIGTGAIERSAVQPRAGDGGKLGERIVRCLARWSCEGGCGARLRAR